MLARFCPLLLLAAWLAPAGLAQSFAFKELIDPTSYESASGAYRLEVESSHRFGLGPGGHVMAPDGAEEWVGSSR